MAKPDMPNFSIGGRIIFGVIAVVVIAAMLRFFGFFLELNNSNSGCRIAIRLATRP